MFNSLVNKYNIILFSSKCTSITYALSVIIILSRIVLCTILSICTLHNKMPSSHIYTIFFIYTIFYIKFSFVKLTGVTNRISLQFYYILAQPFVINLHTIFFKARNKITIKWCKIFIYRYRIPNKLQIK